MKIFTWNRLLWLFVFLSLIVVAAIQIQKQVAVCGDQFAASPERFSQQWWTCPREVNQHARKIGDIGNEDLADVKFSADNLRGWILTKYGTVYGTHDGGGTWQSIGRISYENQISDIIFFTELIVSDNGLHIWAIAKPEPSLHKINASVFSSVDGGRSWGLQTEEPAVVLSLFPFEQLFFMDPSRKNWLVDRNSTTLFSSNGGRRWLISDMNGIKNEEFLYSIAFDESRRIGWALGYDFILKTTDGGQHWQWINTFLKHKNNKKFTSESNNQELKFFSTFHVDKQGRNIWIAGASNTVLHSSDAGETWSQQILPIYLGVTNIIFSDDNLHGWAISNLTKPDSMVLTTSDGGKTWLEKRLPMRTTFNSFFIAQDQKHLWMVGNEGSLLSSIDGGVNWVSKASQLSSNIFDIDVNEQTGQAWLVGNRGMWRSKDNGDTWNNVLSDVANNPYLSSSIRFDITGQRGVVLGAWSQHGDYLTQTSDSGKTWKRIELETLQKDDDSSFLQTTSQIDGFVMSKDGKEILAYGSDRDFLSIDYGETWQRLTHNVNDEKHLAMPKQTNSCSRTFLSKHLGEHASISREQREWDKHPFCQLLNRTKVDASSGKSTIDFQLKNIEIRNEKNDTWIPYSENIFYPALWFTFSTDGKYGMATSYSEGKIIVSEDRGEHWREYAIPTTSRLNTVRHSSDEKQAWAVGERNAMFMSEDNGKTWQAKGLYKRLPPPWFYALCAALSFMYLMLVIFKLRSAYFNKKVN